MFDKAREYVARRMAAEMVEGRPRRRGTPSGLFPAGRTIGTTEARVYDGAPVAYGHLVVETQAVSPEGVPLGEWVEHEQGGNLVVRQAESIMAQMAIGTANSALGYIELGDPAFPATPAQLSDLSLQASTGQRKVVVLTATGNVIRAEATWLAGEGNGLTYTEAGLFNGLLGSGLMFARKVFAGIAKTAAFALRFTWYITFLVNTEGGDCSGIALIGPSTVSAFTIYTAVGAEASVAATFDFSVGANHVDVFLNGARLVPGNDYNEAPSGALNVPIGGPPLNKGVNFNLFTLNPGDECFLIQRTLA